MTGYVVKDECTLVETGAHYATWYMGSDGYVHEDPVYADAYKRRYFAEKKIERYVNDKCCGRYRKVSETECIEAEKWHHHYSIVEVQI